MCLWKLGHFIKGKDCLPNLRFGEGGTLRFLWTPPKISPRMKRKCHLPNIIFLEGRVFSCFRWSAKRFFGSSTQRPLKKRRMDRSSEFGWNKHLVSTAVKNHKFSWFFAYPREIEQMVLWCPTVFLLVLIWSLLCFACRFAEDKKDQQAQLVTYELVHDTEQWNNIWLFGSSRGSTLPLPIFGDRGICNSPYIFKSVQCFVCFCGSTICFSRLFFRGPLHRVIDSHQRNQPSIRVCYIHGSKYLLHYFITPAYSTAFWGVGLSTFNPGGFSGIKNGEKTRGSGALWFLIKARSQSLLKALHVFSGTGTGGHVWSRCNALESHED